jgi:hypothetical protein
MVFNALNTGFFPSFSEELFQEMVKFCNKKNQLIIFVI